MDDLFVQQAVGREVGRGQVGRHVGLHQVDIQVLVQNKVEPEFSGSNHLSSITKNPILLVSPTHVKLNLEERKKLFPKKILTINKCFFTSPPQKSFPGNPKSFIPKINFLHLTVKNCCKKV